MKVATLCYLVKDNQVLLALKKQRFGKGFLNGYGGKVEQGETPEIAVAREIKEEAGVEIDPQSLEKVGIVDFFEVDSHLFECHIFFAHAWSGVPTETEEMGEPQWFLWKSLPIDKMWKGDRQWLPLIFSGKKIHGKAYYSAGMKEVDRFEYMDLAS